MKFKINVTKTIFLIIIIKRLTVVSDRTWIFSIFRDREIKNSRPGLVDTFLKTTMKMVTQTVLLHKIISSEKILISTIKP